MDTDRKPKIGKFSLMKNQHSGGRFFPNTWFKKHSRQPVFYLCPSVVEVFTYFASAINCLNTNGKMPPWR